LGYFGVSKVPVGLEIICCTYVLGPGEALLHTARKGLYGNEYPYRVVGYAGMPVINVLHLLVSCG